MDKLIYTGDQDELTKVAGQIVTFFEDIRGIKSAASNSFTSDMMRQYAPDDDHFGVHLIAMGTGEDYGFNKNGDFWPHKMLAARHHTFHKNGHYFREHNNRSPKLKIGDVKAAAFNDPMKRVELIIWGDKRKAEPEYERAKSGKQSFYSMSCRVPDDVCSCCGNRAKKAAYYCSHLKNHMTQWMPKFSKFAYAVNEDGTFFDISDVANPADRTAHHLEYLLGKDDQEMAKAASEGGFIFSELQAKMAGVNLPEESIMGATTLAQREWLEKLAKAEEYIEQVFDHPGNFNAGDLKFHFVKNAAIYGANPGAIGDEAIATLRTIEPDILFFHMAKRGAVFPFLPFYAFITGQTVKQSSEDSVYKYASERLLPTMFRDALKKPADSEIESLFGCASVEKAASAGMADPVQQVMDKVTEDFSIEEPLAKSRIMKNCADMPDLAGRGMVDGNATEDVLKKAKTFTQAYAMYKVAFTDAVAKLHDNSYVDEPSLLLITFPYRV